jgi:hypothetical protein
VRALWSCEPRSGERVGRASKDRAIIGIARACGAYDQRSGDYTGRASNWFKSSANTYPCKVFTKIRLAFAILGKWNVLGIS